MEIQKTIFVSYGQKDIAQAKLVYNNLTAQGYDVFMYLDEVYSQSIKSMIRDQIAARAHFLIILSPNTLEHYANPNSWLRWEIEIGLEEKRHIIPLMFEGFRFADEQK